jgi:carbon storage regulator CsrA
MSDKGTLILKRKIGERIVIGNGAIVVTVLADHRFSIEAPKNISVHRGELFDKIKEVGVNGTTVEQ